MKETIESIKKLIQKEENMDKKEMNSLLQESLKNLKRNKIEDFVGDFPSFLEPVHLEKNVKLEDDVLIGPKVYIGSNSVVGEFSELSNCIVLDNVSIGEGFKLDHCIIAEGSKLDFNGLKLQNCLIRGSGGSIKEIEIIEI